MNGNQQVQKQSKAKERETFMVSIPETNMTQIAIVIKLLTQMRKFTVKVFPTS